MARRPVPQLPPGTHGLQRDPALVALSQDHHDVLVQALFLKRAGPADEPSVRRTAEEFLRFYRGPLVGHIADEEEVLLPRTEAVDPEAAARIREEHRELAAAAEELTAVLAAGRDPRLVMAAIGQALDDHVRFEERAFFMEVQDRLPAAVLADLGAALEAHRLARGLAPACPLPPRRP